MVSEYNLLLVEDDVSETLIVKFLLNKHGSYHFSFDLARTSSEMLERLRTDKYHAVILDLNILDLEGLPLVDACVHERPDLPIIVRTGNFDKQLANDALKLGVQDFVSKDAFSGHLLERTIIHAIERKKRDNEVRRLAFIDPLTGLGNRRQLSEHWERIRKAPNATRSWTNVFYFDVNGMKQINDTHGHFAGDDTIKTVAKRLEEAMGQAASIYRVGGDEFCGTITSDVSVDRKAEALKVLARLKAGLAAPAGSTGNLPVSIAMGCVDYPTANLPSLEVALDAADREMYKDKRKNAPTQLKTG